MLQYYIFIFSSENFLAERLSFGTASFKLRNGRKSEPAPRLYRTRWISHKCFNSEAFSGSKYGPSWRQMRVKPIVVDARNATLPNVFGRIRAVVAKMSYTLCLYVFSGVPVSISLGESTGQKAC